MNLHFTPLREIHLKDMDDSPVPRNRLTVKTFVMVSQPFLLFKKNRLLLAYRAKASIGLFQDNIL